MEPSHAPLFQSLRRCGKISDYGIVLHASARSQSGVAMNYHKLGKSLSAVGVYITIGAIFLWFVNYGGSLMRNPPDYGYISCIFSTPPRCQIVGWIQNIVNGQFEYNPLYLWVGVAMGIVGEIMIYSIDNNQVPISSPLQPNSTLADSLNFAHQNHLGEMFRDGKGLRHDDEEAVRHFRDAAEAGYPPAQFNLGMMYVDGRGVSQDDYDATHWFSLAAEQGYAPAQCSYATMLADGRGVPHNQTEALRLYYLSAEQNHLPAMHNLGYIHEKGIGVAQDIAEAIKWYRKASDAGYAPSQYALALCYETGTGLQQNDRHALYWMRRSADQGHEDSQIWMGHKSAKGEGVKIDQVKALVWFSLAANQGNHEAAKLRDALGKTMSQSQISDAYRQVKAWKPKLSKKP